MVWITLAIERMRGSSKHGPTICRPAGTLRADELINVIRNVPAIQSM